MKTISSENVLSSLLGKRWLIISVAFAAFVILFSRRFDQLLAPQVWDEDGVIIVGWLNQGLGSLFQRVNGYLVVLPKLMSLVALLFPLGIYPIVSTVIDWLLSIGLLMLIVFVPSRLRGGPLLLIAIAFVPSSPEVYGIPLYIIWWAALVSVAGVFWLPSSNLRSATWRAVALVLAGLSSPMILLLAPLYVAKALWQKSRADIAEAVGAVVCVLCQGSALISARTAAGITFSPPSDVVAKFCGDYLLRNFLVPVMNDAPIMLYVGVASIIVFVVTVIRDKPMRPIMVVLLYLWFGSMMLSVLRVNVMRMDPDLAGPRYFFFPFVIEGIMLVQMIIGGKYRSLRVIALTMLCFAVVNTWPVLSRAHDDLGWPAAVSECASIKQGVVSLPVEYDGRFTTKVAIGVFAGQCRALAKGGLLATL